MCGRFVQTITRGELLALLGLSEMRGAPADFRPRHNLAPGQDAVVVRAVGDGRRIGPLRWGLIPNWAKDPAIAHKLINARVETAAEKPSFRAAWRARRGLVPANGWYEWTGAGGVRQPWLVRRRDGAPLFFAGLWERWLVPEEPAESGAFAGSGPGGAVETFTILTTEAAGDAAAIHHRMPVLVRPDRFESWLAGEARPPQPPREGELETLAVSTRVNDVRNDGPDCLLPASGPVPGGLGL